MRVPSLWAKGEGLPVLARVVAAILLGLKVSSSFQCFCSAWSGESKLHDRLVRVPRNLEAVREMRSFPRSYPFRNVGTHGSDTGDHDVHKKKAERARCAKRARSPAAMPPTWLVEAQKSRRSHIYLRFINTETEGKEGGDLLTAIGDSIPGVVCGRDKIGVVESGRVEVKTGGGSSHFKLSSETEDVSHHNNTWQGQLGQ